MEGPASLALADGQCERAAFLFGAAGSLLDSIGNPAYAYTPDRATLRADIDGTRSRSGGNDFDAAWARRHWMTMEQARTSALQRCGRVSGITSQAVSS